MRVCNRVVREGKQEESGGSFVRRNRFSGAVEIYLFVFLSSTISILEKYDI